MRYTDRGDSERICDGERPGELLGTGGGPFIGPFHVTSVNAGTGADVCPDAGLGARDRDLDDDGGGDGIGDGGGSGGSFFS